MDSSSHKSLLNENLVGVYFLASEMPFDSVAYSHFDFGSMDSTVVSVGYSDIDIEKASAGRGLALPR